MGESNMFEGNVLGGSADDIEIDTPFGRLAVPGTAEAGTRLSLCIRPEQILATVGEDRGLVALGELQVEEVSFFGTHHRCLGHHLESNASIIIRLPQDRVVRVGEKLHLAVKREDIVLLRH
jgi:ABC-type Fe3+/spermidine/putrescine transport system ATPase subunit